MKTTKKIELKLLKGMLWIYIILSVIIAGLNFGYAQQAPPSVAAFITWFWHFYENWIKTLFIILGSILTLRIIRTSGRTAMVKRNLVGFTLAALVVHIVGPWLTGNSELYFFAMPLPWSTTPLQMLYTESPFYLSRFPVWGAAGISASLIFYLVISGAVLIGTLLWGRRWQCSTLCLFNGFASEVFAPAVPLVGKKRKVPTTKLKLWEWLRWVFLAIALFFSLWWILFLLGFNIMGDLALISSIEVYKYLAAELLMMMFFWIAFLARGYCYYCPLGTVLAFLGKIAGQRIKTDNSHCIECNRCNKACPMSIDIKSRAKIGEAVYNLRCVGCGHCIDSCPTETLSYSTRFIDWIHNKGK